MSFKEIPATVKDRWCTECGTLLVRNKTDSNANWRTRKICGAPECKKARASRQSRDQQIKRRARKDTRSLLDYMD